MDGIETARQIRKRICKEITIIVLTSYEFSEIEEEAKAAGIDAFIAKPLFRSRLTATLRQFTSGKTEKTARNYLEELAKADYTGKRILLVEDNELPESVKFILFCNQLSKQNWLSIALIAVFFQFPH